MSKNYLFYFIHPAKFHAFRITINTLIKNGHKVDVFIITKDIIEDLVKSEGWNYINIFPEGRRIKFLHTYLSAAINLVRTIYRLFKYMKGKKYDLIITDDLATIVGRIKRIPTIFFTYDDLKAVSESIILISTANHILCPSVAYMGPFNYKKIGYIGLKSLAHLHPNHFKHNITLLPKDLQIEAKKYFLIRCVSATSTHDVGKKGLDDELLISLIELLSKYGRVIINTQRDLPEALKKYVYPINKIDIAHYIYFSKIFISDSTTMCAEAAVLGVPSIEIDDWYNDFEQYKVLSNKYGLLRCFKPNQKNQIINYLEILLNNQNLEEEFNSKRKEFLENHIDLSTFMIWLFENYPYSLRTLKSNPNFQLNFK